MLSEFYNHAICFPCFDVVLNNFILCFESYINSFFLPVPGLESITGPLEEIALHDHTIGCIHIEFQLGVIVGKVLHRGHICRKFVVRVGLTVNIYSLDAHWIELKMLKTAKFW